MFRHFFRAAQNSTSRGFKYSRRIHQKQEPKQEQQQNHQKHSEKVYIFSIYGLSFLSLHLYLKLKDAEQAKIIAVNQARREELQNQINMLGKLAASSRTNNSEPSDTTQNAIDEISAKYSRR